MIEQIVTWRELLGNMIANLKERKRIADQLKVNTVTLTRWANDTSNPRQDKLLLLLEALPQYRIQMWVLMEKEFPQFFPGETNDDDISPEIPSAFYDRILRGIYREHNDFTQFCSEYCDLATDAKSTRPV